MSTLFIHRAIMLCADTDREAVNAELEALGWGPNNMSVELKSRLGAKQTVWGCNIALTQEMLEAAQKVSGLTVEAQDYRIERPDLMFAEKVETRKIDRVLRDESGVIAR